MIKICQVLTRVKKFDNKRAEITKHKHIFN